MTVTVATDTCVTLWLAQHAAKRLSRRALEILAEAELYVPSCVWLEFDFQHQKNAIRNPSSQAVKHLLAKDFSLVTRTLDVGDLCAAAASLSWTREPFDRLIVGEAMALKLPLVTSDRTIREHYKKAIW